MIPRLADNRALRLGLAYLMADYQPLANVGWIRTAHRLAHGTVLRLHEIWLCRWSATALLSAGTASRA